jgi:MFS family permease
MMLLAFFGTSSKIIFGRLSETITARLAYVVILILQGVGLAILVVSGGSIASWGGIVVLGLGTGGVGALMPLVIADAFGLRQFGSIMGLTKVPIIIPVVAGPIMAGMIYEATGGYNLVFLITIAMLILSVGAFSLARTPPREVLPLRSPKS